MSSSVLGLQDNVFIQFITGVHCHTHTFIIEWRHGKSIEHTLFIDSKTGIIVIRIKPCGTQIKLKRKQMKCISSTLRNQKTIGSRLPTKVDAYIIRYGFQCQFIFHAIIQLVSAFLLNRWNSLLGFIRSSEVLFLLFITISYKHFQFISRWIT